MRASKLLALFEDVSLITLLRSTSFSHANFYLRSSRRGSARSVFELRQHFESFFDAARQYHLIVGEF